MPAHADDGPAPVAAVTVTAPVRIADVGGWTDTWFAKSGAVCHIGVGPGVTVTAALLDGATPALPIRVIAPDIGVDYSCGPSPDTGWAALVPSRHPLIEHAIASVCAEHAPSGPVTITIASAVAPGASMGTSASVAVAVIAALKALLCPAPIHNTDHFAGDAQRAALASLAHQVETVAAGREAGVQDQWAAAFGGAQLIRIDPYPHTTRRAIEIEPAFQNALKTQVVTVVIGRHDSSAVHRDVITSFTTQDATTTRRHEALDTLRTLAFGAADAIGAGDLTGWAHVLTRSTQTQQQLHPGLVGPAHHELIDHARATGAMGWKVNGAGGNGGSLSVVFSTAQAARRFADQIRTKRPAWSVHRLVPSPGVTVATESTDN